MVIGEPTLTLICDFPVSVSHAPWLSFDQLQGREVSPQNAFVICAQPVTEYRGVDAAEVTVEHHIAAVELRQ